ncbi:MAG: FecR domain-containing protein [Betaproteobacteria bacterium]|nr:FecR domain-containing protein [Betaproteobacteria bacterium]
MRIALPRTFLPALLLVLLSIQPAAAADWIYLTRPGDTPAGVGQQYLSHPNDWKKIRIPGKAQRSLPPGVRLHLPVSLLRRSPAPATVLDVTGEVRISKAAAPLTPEPGTRMHGGETVQTGPDGRVAFRLADGSRVTLMDSGKVSFTRLTGYGKTGMVASELRLERGRLEVAAARQTGPAGRFRIQTPAALAELQESALRLHLSPDGKRLNSEVTDGVVTLSARGKSVRLAGGSGLSVRAGHPPGKPRPLPARPDLTGLSARIVAPSPAFVWRADPAARAWRVQLAAAEGARPLLRETVVSEPTLRWAEDLADGAYVLRIRAVDERGLEGLDGLHPFTLDARPQAPALIQPAQGEKLEQTRTLLTWARAEEAHGYLLQLARSGDFTGELTEQRFRDETRYEADLAPGPWFWRMTSLDARDEARPWGAVRTFRVHPRPPAPADAVCAATPDQADCTWSASAGATRYGLELLDAQGVRAAQREVAEPRIHFSGLKPGAYQWRLRGLDPDGVAGPWSGDQPLLIPPAPPLPETPGVNQRTLLPEVAMIWKPSAGALGYLVQVSEHPDFANPVAELRTTATTFIWRAPRTGSWHWRIAALGEAGASSGYAQARAFLFQPKPQKVQHIALGVDDKEMRASWQGQSPRYRVELAQDEGFTQIVTKQETVQPEFRMTRPAPARYWLRVTPLDADGVTGPASDAVSAEVKPPFWMWLAPALLIL